MAILVLFSLLIVVIDSRSQFSSHVHLLHSYSGDYPDNRFWSIDLSRISLFLLHILCLRSLDHDDAWFAEIRC
ncbi:unnamed protein product [Arabis nemorensis]|uniref:Uncharacterized protein n=1 Tax=Arabis nemorensis TaxID=586526 RepID=A0A565C4C0_9BRAS|nr:unnamed protein product [Arabis nemorensis]